MIEELKSILPKEPVKNIYGFNNYYGVRIPELRKIAKKIVKENRLDYLKEKHDSFEELTIVDINDYDYISSEKIRWKFIEKD